MCVRAAEKSVAYFPYHINEQMEIDTFFMFSELLQLCLLLQEMLSP